MSCLFAFVLIDWCHLSKQGRLEPIETTVKKNKRGLGAEKAKKVIKQSKDKDKDDPEVSDNFPFGKLIDYFWFTLPTLLIAVQL